MITLIVARDRRGAIGKAGALPWSIPEDLAAFRQETRGGALIMGRRTWESLPSRPLPERLNLVVSSTLGTDDAYPTVDAAVHMARSLCFRRIYGIGGRGIYDAMMPIAERILVTDVDLEVEDPDAFFPPIDPGAWRENTSRSGRTVAPGITFRDFRRKL